MLEKIVGSDIHEAINMYGLQEKKKQKAKTKEFIVGYSRVSVTAALSGVLGSQ